MDDNDDDHDEDHGDEMGDDMDDDFDMDLPNTEVSIPENFDPATAMFELGLATANGYHFQPHSMTQWPQRYNDFYSFINL